MEAPGTSPSSACSSLLNSLDSDEYDEHNMWTPMVGLLSDEHVGAFMEENLDEVILGRIALSWHFALHLLCVKADCHCTEARHRANIALCENLCRIPSVAVTSQAVL